MSKTLDKMEKELGSWRTKLDELRVQANLGKKELRDRHPDLVKDFDDAYRSAKESMGKLADTGISGGRTVVDGLEAGWDELRRAVEKLRKSKDD